MVNCEPRAIRLFAQEKQVRGLTLRYEYRAICHPEESENAGVIFGAGMNILLVAARRAA